jgi:hypothetical protein
VILIAIKLTSLPLFFVFSSTSIKSFHKYTKIKVGLSIIISSGVSLFFLAPPLYAEGRVEKPSRSCGNCRQYPAPREIFPPLAEFRWPARNWVGNSPAMRDPGDNSRPNLNLRICKKLAPHDCGAN